MQDIISFLLILEQNKDIQKLLMEVGKMSDPNSKLKVVNDFLSTYECNNLSNFEKFILPLVLYMVSGTVSGMLHLLSDLINKNTKFLLRHKNLPYDLMADDAAAIHSRMRRLQHKILDSIEELPANDTNEQANLVQKLQELNKVVSCKDGLILNKQRAILQQEVVARMVDNGVMNIAQTLEAFKE